MPFKADVKFRPWALSPGDWNLQWKILFGFNLDEISEDSQAVQTGRLLLQCPCNCAVAPRCPQDRKAKHTAEPPSQRCWEPGSLLSHVSVSESEWTLDSCLWQASTHWEKDQIVLFWQKEKRNQYLAMLPLCQSGYFWYLDILFPIWYPVYLDVFDILDVFYCFPRSPSPALTAVGS